MEDPPSHYRFHPLHLGTEGRRFGFFLLEIGQRKKKIRERKLTAHTRMYVFPLSHIVYSL